MKNKQVTTIINKTSQIDRPQKLLLHLHGALTDTPTELLAFKSSDLKASINLKYFKTKQEKANKPYYLFSSMAQIPNFIISPNACKYKLDGKFERL